MCGLAPLSLSLSSGQIYLARIFQTVARLFSTRLSLSYVRIRMITRDYRQFATTNLYHCSTKKKKEKEKEKSWRS